MRLFPWLLCFPLFCAPLAYAEEAEIDVRGGIFEERLDTQPHERKSRYEEVRQNRVDRNPRNVPERQLADQLLDATVDSATAGSAKHGLDAAQNINEALEIKKHRLEQNQSSEAPH